MRVFLDTNVLVAAFATRGICADLFRAVLLEHDLILGESVLEELERILQRKFKLPLAKVYEITAFLREQSVVVKPEQPASWPKTDADDRWIVAAALDGKAEILVTGDEDLLKAVQQDIQVETPRGFWEMLRAG